MEPPSFRSASPGDAPNIIALLRREYDSTYPWQMLYDEHKLRFMIECRTLRILVAETGGRFAAMAGLKYSVNFPGALEYTLLIVASEYRRLGLGSSLLARITDLALEKDPGELSLYAHVVTFNTYSQRELIKLGLRPVGIVPQRFCVYSSETGGLRRHSHIVMCRPFLKLETERLYIPPDLSDHIRSLYQGLGVAIGEAASDLEDSFRVNAFRQSGYYEFFGGLPDTEAKSVTVFLNMAEPSCPERYAGLRIQGFVYTGIQPLLDKREYLIMHKAVRLAKNLAEIQTVPEFDSTLRFITARI
jgi:RimJ/RimL family protein N-acetyltransferase